MSQTLNKDIMLNVCNVIVLLSYIIVLQCYCITNCVTVYRSVILISLNWGLYSVLRICIGSGSTRGFLQVIMKCNSTCLNVERFIPYLNSWTVEAPLQNASYKSLPVKVIGYPVLIH